VFARHGVTQCALLASSFRSGSTYTAALLAENGVPGLGHERFNRAWAADDVDAYLDTIVAPFAGGRFATKLMWPQRSNLARKLNCPREASARFAASFPGAHWLHVRRRDHFAQAISFWRAKQTNRWHVYAPGEEPDLAYNFAQIDTCARELALHERLWCDFFTIAGITPHTVFYEDMVADPTVLNPYLAAFGTRITHTRVALRQQRDARSARYRDQYLTDLYARGD